MNHITVVLVAFLALMSSAHPAIGAEKPREDATLPRPMKDQSAEYYAQLAKVHSAFGFYEPAEKLQLKAIEVETDRARKEKRSFELFEGIYCKAKWWDKAAEEILRTIELTQKGAAGQERKYHLDRAWVLGQAGRADEQTKELETVLRLSKDESEKERALRRLHLVLKRLDRLQLKIDEYEALVKKNPKDVTTLRILAEIYYGQGLEKLPGKAIEKYEQIRKFAPDDINACERLARLYLEAEQQDKSLAMYERLLKLNPKRFRMYFTDAVSLMLTNHKEKEVIVWCEKIGKMHPQSPEVPLRIANIYSGERKHAEAAEHYKKAIALTGEHAQKLLFYFRLIECQISARQYAEAEKSCREAQKLRILSPSLRKRLKRLLNKARDLQGRPKEE